MLVGEVKIHEKNTSGKWAGKKIIIVNSSSTFEYRVNLFKSVMEEQGAEVLIVGSDFDHIKKCKRNSDDPKRVLLTTIPYYKNISLQRIRSHLKFSKDAYNYIKDKQCDLLYIVIPPNLQSSIAKKYKESYPDTKIIFDIIDLWPESFPNDNTDKFPFTVWGNVRNKNLNIADKIIIECNLYHKYLKNYCDKSKLQTIYWCHEAETPEQTKAVEENIKTIVPPDDKWVLGYLGSINYIIDIDKICSVIKTLQQSRPVTVKIIGDGVNVENFLSSLRATGAEVVNYGKVYDFNKKLEILGTCHYGINIMKSTVRVGMSMKSVDYLQLGVPVLNGIPGDMEDIVFTYHCGVNAEELQNDNRYDVQMKMAARSFYLEKCSYFVYMQDVSRLI